MQKIGMALVLGVLVAGSAAWGESAQMRGKFPANVRAANLLEFVVVDRFDGQDGRQFEAALSQAIGAAGGRPDGALSGGVTTGVEQNRYQGTETRCVEWKDGKEGGDCLKRAEVKVPCTRRVINLTVSVRLVRMATTCRSGRTIAPRVTKPAGARAGRPAVPSRKRYRR